MRIERDAPGRAQPEPSLTRRLAVAATKLRIRLHRSRGNAGGRPNPE